MSERMPGQRFQNQPTAGPDRPADDSPSPTTQAPVSVERYRKGGPWVGVLVGIVVVAFLVAMVLVGNRILNNPSPGTQATPELPTCATPSPGWQSIPYEYGSSTGCWAVSEGQWDGDMVTVATTVTADQGSVNVTFFALENAHMDNQYDPIGGSMRTASVASGQSSSGTVVFQIPRGDFTLYMTKNPSSNADQPIQALVISG